MGRGRRSGEVCRLYSDLDHGERVWSDQQSDHQRHTQGEGRPLHGRSIEDFGLGTSASELSETYNTGNYLQVPGSHGQSIEEYQDVTPNLNITLVIPEEFRRTASKVKDKARVDKFDETFQVEVCSQVDIVGEVLDDYDDNVAKKDTCAMSTIETREVTPRSAILKRTEKQGDKKDQAGSLPFLEELKKKLSNRSIELSSFDTKPKSQTLPASLEFTVNQDCDKKETKINEAHDTLVETKEDIVPTQVTVVKERGDTIIDAKRDIGKCVKKDDDKSVDKSTGSKAGLKNVEKSTSFPFLDELKDRIAACTVRISPETVYEWDQKYKWPKSYKTKAKATIGAKVLDNSVTDKLKSDLGDNELKKAVQTSHDISFYKPIAQKQTSFLSDDKLKVGVQTGSESSTSLCPKNIDVSRTSTESLDSSIDTETLNDSANENHREVAQTVTKDSEALNDSADEDQIQREITQSVVKDIEPLKDSGDDDETQSEIVTKDTDTKSIFQNQDWKIAQVFAEYKEAKEHSADPDKQFNQPLTKDTEEIKEFAHRDVHLTQTVSKDSEAINDSTDYRDLTVDEDTADQEREVTLTVSSKDIVEINDPIDQYRELTHTAAKDIESLKESAEQERLVIQTPVTDSINEETTSDSESIGFIPSAAECHLLDNLPKNINTEVNSRFTGGNDSTLQETEPSVTSLSVNKTADNISNDQECKFRPDDDINYVIDKSSESELEFKSTLSEPDKKLETRVLQILNVQCASADEHEALDNELSVDQLDNHRCKSEQGITERNRFVPYVEESHSNLVEDNQEIETRYIDRKQCISNIDQFNLSNSKDINPTIEAFPVCQNDNHNSEQYNLDCEKSLSSPGKYYTLHHQGYATDLRKDNPALEEDHLSSGEYEPNLLEHTLKPDECVPDADKDFTNPYTFLSKPDKCSSNSDELLPDLDKNFSNSDKLLLNPDKNFPDPDKLLSKPNKCSTNPDKLLSNQDKNFSNLDRYLPDPDKSKRVNKCVPNNEIHNSDECSIERYVGEGANNEQNSIIEVEQFNQKCVEKINENSNHSIDWEVLAVDNIEKVDIDHSRANVPRDRSGSVTSDSHQSFNPIKTATANETECYITAGGDVSNNHYSSKSTATQESTDNSTDRAECINYSGYTMEGNYSDSAAYPTPTDMMDSNSYRHDDGFDSESRIYDQKYTNVNIADRDGDFDCEENFNKSSALQRKSHALTADRDGDFDDRENFDNRLNSSRRESRISGSGDRNIKNRDEDFDELDDYKSEERRMNRKRMTAGSLNSSKSDSYERADNLNREHQQRPARHMTASSRVTAADGQGHARVTAADGQGHARVTAADGQGHGRRGGEMYNNKQDDGHVNEDYANEGKGQYSNDNRGQYDNEGRGQYANEGKGHHSKEGRGQYNDRDSRVKNRNESGNMRQYADRNKDADDGEIPQRRRGRTEHPVNVIVTKADVHLSPEELENLDKLASQSKNDRFHGNHQDDSHDRQNRSRSAGQRNGQRSDTMNRKYQSHTNLSRTDADHNASLEPGRMERSASHHFTPQMRRASKVRDFVRQSSGEDDARGSVGLVGGSQVKTGEGEPISRAITVADIPKSVKEFTMPRSKMGSFQDFRPINHGKSMSRLSSDKGQSS